MTWDGDGVADPRVCADCGVIVVPAGDAWEHPEPLRVKFSRTVCVTPTPGRAPKDRELRYGRGTQVKADRAAVHGQLDVPAAGGPLVVACDGAHKRNPAGPPWMPISWGYVATNGQWGMGWTPQPLTVVGDRVLGCELRAIFWARERLPKGQPIEVLTDSTDAVDLIERWRAGDLVMPPGYSVHRPSGHEAKLMLLARRAAAEPEQLRVRWVRAGGGDPLHRGADALAKTARMWAVEDFSADEAREAGERLARAALARHTPSR